MLPGSRGCETRETVGQVHRMPWEPQGLMASAGACRRLKCSSELFCSVLINWLCFPPTVPRDFPYEEDSRPRSQSSKAAIPPPVYEEQDRPRSPTGPGNSFLANMG